MSAAPTAQELRDEIEAALTKAMRATYSLYADALTVASVEIERALDKLPLLWAQLAGGAGTNEHEPPRLSDEPARCVGSDQPPEDGTPSVRGDRALSPCSTCGTWLGTNGYGRTLPHCLPPSASPPPVPELGYPQLARAPGHVERRQAYDPEKGAPPRVCICGAPWPCTSAPVEGVPPPPAPAATEPYEFHKGTFCVQCGVGVRVDEDGCCKSCGATAIGNALDAIWDRLVAADSPACAPVDAPRVHDTVECINRVAAAAREQAPVGHDDARIVAEAVAGNALATEAWLEATRRADASAARVEWLELLATVDGEVRGFHGGAVCVYWPNDEIGWFAPWAGVVEGQRVRVEIYSVPAVGDKEN